LNSTLSINYLNSTSTTTFNNLNSLSTNSILSINGHTTQISNSNATSTTIFHALNSLSTNSILSINGHTTQISNLNTTSTSLLSYINTLSTSSIFSSGNINISGTTKLNNSVTCILSLNISGVTTFLNKVGIGMTPTNGNLEILGIANIHNGTRAAILSYNFNPGNSIIGTSTGLNYGGGTFWNVGNTAGLMMQCISNTEIVVHDSGNRLASLMYYDGDTTNKITIGREYGMGQNK
jgi:hypothetical protein